MVIADAEAQIEAQGTWGDEKAVQSGIDSDGSTRLGRTSIQDGGQSLSANRDDRTGGNFTDQYRQAIIGGILDRLIFSVTEEIAELEHRAADRKEYLKELKTLSEQLRKAPAESK